MDKLSNLELFRKVAETGDVPAAGSRFIYPPTIAKTLGFRLLEVGPGTATMELMADTEVHANPMGTVHGGVLCDIADAAIGTAHASSLLNHNPKVQSIFNLWPPHNQRGGHVHN